MILQGDVLTVLRGMRPESVDMCVTSPPYWGLRDYGLPPQVWGGEDHEHVWGDEKRVKGPMKWDTSTGKVYEKQTTKLDVSQGCFCECGAWKGSLGLEPTPYLYVEHLVQVGREVRRVLKEHGTFWLNLGDCFAGSGKGPSGGKIRQSAAGVSQPYVDGRLKPKDLVGIPWRAAFALQDDGWWLRSDIIWHKPNPMPESVRDRPTRSHEYVFLLSKSRVYYYDKNAILEPLAVEQGSPRAFGGTKYGGGSGSYSGKIYEPGKLKGKNKRSVWSVTPAQYRGAHFAVFPEELIEPCILAGTSERGCCSECGKPWKRIVEKKKPPKEAYTKTNRPDNINNISNPELGNVGMGGTLQKWRDENPPESVGWEATCTCEADVTPAVVLDPFLGSGTTAVVARRHNRDWVGIELNKDYAELASERIASVAHERILETPS